MAQSSHRNSTLSQFTELTHRSKQLQLQSDAELLELYVAGGNRDAFEGLVTRYAPLVASVCALTVADRSSAEDAFQATFLILLVQAKKIRKRASLAAWLHGVAYRCACRLRKQNRLQSIAPRDEAEMAVADLDFDPVASLARKMNLEALDRELENLPDQLREPLVEHYLLGFTAPQIAERMELSVAAVEGRLRRGRHALRSRLARRGVSLAVLAAGSELFLEHLSAAEGATWTMHLLDVYLPTGAPGSSPDTAAPPINSPVSSLVHGETAMLSAGSLKTVAVAGVLLVGGAIVAFGLEHGGTVSSSSAGHSQSIVLPADADERTVLAQIASSSSSASTDRSAGKAASSPAVGGGGSSGASGMSAGSFGVSEGGAMMAGAMGGVNPFGGVSSDWVRPEAAENAEPAWLAGGRTALEAIEKNRAVLSTQLDFSFVQTPLAEVATFLTEQTGTKFEINAAEVEQGGLATLDSPITAEGTQTSVREIIRRTTASLGLTYVVRESTIEITTIDAAKEDSNLRFYDLAYVLPNSTNASALISAITQTIEPGSWNEAGISLVGSMMIVSATDTTHQQIEILLLNLAKMNPHNAEQPSWTGSTVFGSGGFGGGGGGMGGMGGGGMGGGGMGGGGMF